MSEHSEFHFLMNDNRTMNKEEFCGYAYERLPTITDPVDVECVQSCLEQCYEEGFTLDDAITYTKHTEHVSPDLEEGYACRILNEIARKYRANKPRN